MKRSLALVDRLTSGGVYVYTVVAYDAAGNVSPASAPVVVTL